MMRRASSLPLDEFDLKPLSGKIDFVKSVYVAPPAGDVKECARRIETLPDVVDENGFVSIKGRCKRFAKIGGEMVSLLSVEMVIEKKWPGFISGAVNIPDPKKGEKIVLITTCQSITKEGLIEAFVDMKLKTKNYSKIEKQMYRESLTFMLCKAAGLDVRTYCNSALFERFVKSGSNVSSYLSKTFKLFNNLLVYFQ
jgi:hypothetical protein